MHTPEEEEEAHVISGFAKGTQVLLWNGTAVSIEDVYAGDRVLGTDGMPRRVVDLHRGFSGLLRVCLPDPAQSFMCSGTHILHLRTEPLRQLSANALGISVRFVEMGELKIDAAAPHQMHVPLLRVRAFAYSEFGAAGATERAQSFHDALQAPLNGFRWRIPAQFYDAVPAEVRSVSSLVTAPVRFQSCALGPNAESMAFFLGVWLAAGVVAAADGADTVEARCCVCPGSFALALDRLQPECVAMLEKKAPYADLALRRTRLDVAGGFEVLGGDGELDAAFHRELLVADSAAPQESFRHNYVPRVATDCFTDARGHKTVPRWLLSAKAAAREQFLLGAQTAQPAALKDPDVRRGIASVARSLGLQSESAPFLLDVVRGPQPVPFRLEECGSGGFYGLQFESTEGGFLLDGMIEV